MGIDEKELTTLRHGKEDKVSDSVGCVYNFWSHDIKSNSVSSNYFCPSQSTANFQCYRLVKSPRMNTHSNFFRPTLRALELLCPHTVIRV